MKKIKVVYILLIVLCVVAVAGIFFAIGYKTAYDRIEAATPTLKSQTFYASISDIRDSTLSVQGMDVNDNGGNQTAGGKSSGGSNRRGN